MIGQRAVYLYFPVFFLDRREVKSNYSEIKGQLRMSAINPIFGTKKVLYELLMIFNLGLHKYANEQTWISQLVLSLFRKDVNLS